MRWFALVASMTAVVVAASAYRGDAASTSSSVTVRCASQAYVVDVDPAGSVRVLEYTTYTPEHPMQTPTGRVLSYIDSSTRQVNPFCKATRPLKTRTHVLVGPYARSPQSRVFCGNTTGTPQARYVQIRVEPVLNRMKQQVGNRLIATLDSLTVANASITRRGGGVSFDPFKCVRNSPYFK